MSRLNTAQRNSVAITLRQLERALARAEALLGGPAEGTLSRTVTPVTPERADDARRFIEEARREIAATAAAFGLPVEEQDGRREIAGLLALAWEGLEDARAAKLRRYGAVDPALADSLDPRVERLIALVLALERAVSDQHSASSNQETTEG